MVRAKKKWYNSILFYFIVGLIVLVGLYFLLKKTTVYFNYHELLKTENVSLKKENDSLLVVYKNLEQKRQKIKIIREKISTAAETDKIKDLEKQLADLRLAKKDTITKKDSPIELYKYFNK